MPEAKTQTLCLLFVDASGVGAGTSEHGTPANHDLQEGCLSVAGEVRKRHGGGVLRSTGSTLLCSFTAADAALDAAEDIRDAVRARVPETAARCLKMGLHAGVVTFGEGGLSGDTVTTLARLVVSARPGQTLLTEDVRQLAGPANRQKMLRAGRDETLESRLGTRLYDYPGGAAAGNGAVPLPRRDGRLETQSVPMVEVHRTTVAAAPVAPATNDAGSSNGEPGVQAAPQEVQTTGKVASAPASGIRSKKMIFPHKRAAATPPTVASERTQVLSATDSNKIATKDRRVGGRPPAGGADGAKAAAQKQERVPRLCLVHRNQVVVVDEIHRPVVTIGREDSNDIVLSLETVSRRHAEVRCRGGAFYVTDHSWNGTYLYAADGGETHVHKADARLTSHGMICPGCPAYEAGVEVIQFLPGV